MLMMSPWLCPRMMGIAAWHARRTPKKLVSICARASAIGVSSTEPITANPATVHNNVDSPCFIEHGLECALHRRVIVDIQSDHFHRPRGPTDLSASSIHRVTTICEILRTRRANTVRSTCNQNDLAHFSSLFSS
jgi:hypothetical protein